MVTMTCKCYSIVWESAFGPTGIVDPVLKKKKKDEMFFIHLCLFMFKYEAVTLTYANGFLKLQCWCFSMKQRTVHH